jgi:hypothetical protein
MMNVVNEEFTQQNIMDQISDAGDLYGKERLA